MLYLAVTALLGGVGVPPAAAEDTGLLRVAHLSPDTPAVDVALTPLPADGSPVTDPGPDIATGLGYGDVSGYLDLPAGRYAVSVRAAGSPPSTPPVLTTDVRVAAGTARTVLVGGRFADLTLQVLPDDLSAAPAASARVRVLSAAEGAGPLDVTWDDVPLARRLPFATAGRYVTVPAGAGVLDVDGTPGPALQLPAGAVVTLLVLDASDGGFDVATVIDAAGPAEVPSGAVEAGGGPAPVAPVVLVLAGAALAGRVLRSGSRPALAALGLALTVPLVPVAVPGASRAAAPPVTAPPVTAPPVSASPVSASPALTSSSAATPPVPVHVRIPTAGVDAALVAVGLDPTGALAPPDEPSEAGWYSGGPVPGATGPAVLTAHVDWAGRPAAFAGLGRVAPGDEVLVERADGTTARFRVDDVQRVAKDAFPTGTVYGPTPSAELRLITCGGEFDPAAGSYRDNVVVTASLVG